MPALPAHAPETDHSPAAAGHRYLRGVSRAERRQEGLVYTPPGLVAFILGLTGLEAAGTPIGPMLDPACGAGAFLQGAVRLLLQGWLPGDPQELTARLESLLFGIDTDPVACRLARLAVRQEVQKHLPGVVLPPRFFRDNILQADFLRDSLVEDLADKLGGFAVVLGNPPYVTTDRLSTEHKDELRGRYSTANGRLDLYVLFMERGLELLRPDGRLAFITPNKYLTSESARPMRGLLLRTGALERLAQFRSHRVFAEAATVPCVTVFRKGAPPVPFELLECGTRDTGEVQVLAQVQVPAPSGDPAWHMVGPGSAVLAARIQGQHPTLQEYAERISAGIATGRDRILVASAASVQDLEPELWRPAIRGQDLQAFRLQDPDLRILLPYREGPRGRPELVDLDSFPLTRSFLEPHRTELERRHCVRTWGKAWFDLHDPWTRDVTRELKILVPDVANTNRFVLDEGRFCPLHSAYYLLPRGIDPRYLLAMLNSAPLEFLIRLHAPVVKDGFSRYRKQFLRTLPIPRTSPAEEEAIAAAVARGTLEEAQERVERLFGLEAGEQRQIRLLLQQLRTP